MDGNGAGRPRLRKAGDTPSAVAGQWAPATANAEARTVEVVWTAGAPIERIDPWTGELFVEQLEVSDRAVDLSRLNAGVAPLLDSHARDSVRSQLGIVERAWIQGGKGHALVRFAESARDVFDAVQAGTVTGVSVGYSISKQTRKERKGAPPLITATRWQPMELSLTPIPADVAARTRSHPSYQRAEGAGKRIMENEATNGAAQTTSLQTVETRERERCASINRAADKLNQRELGNRLIAEGVAADEALRQIIDEAAAVPSNDVEISNHVAFGANEARARSFADEAGEALLVRQRILKDPKSPGAREFVDATLSDLAERSLELMGVNTRAIRDKQKLFERAFITSTTLADTLAVFSTRALLSGYEAVPRTFVDAFRESVSRNFKPNERIRVSDTPALAIVAEGAAFQEVSLSDRKEVFVIAKYGHILKYTIEALVNDDLDAIGREAERAGFAAAVTESDVFFSVITTNAAMSDTNPIFGAGTNNLVTGVALSADALEDAREYFRTVETENGVKLNLQPRFLFVAPDLERTAEKLVRPPVNHSTATLTDVLSSQYASQLELRVEARLPAGDWMLAADFRAIDTLEYAWLEGRAGVRVEQDGDFDTMGLKFRVSDMFGAGCVDRRGLYYADLTP